MLNGLALGLKGGSTSNFGNIVAGGRAGGGVAGVSNRRNQVSLFELPAEPAALSAIAKGDGDMADAAKQVVSLVSWPGKPPPPAVAPRSPAEEKLFQAGTSECKNWIAAAGVLHGSGLAARLVDYVACYRSEGGTGTGAGFVYWR